MEIIFLEIAQRELDEAVNYYNSHSPGLGDLFLLEVLGAIERIQTLPDAWMPFTENTRRCQIRRFPYGIVYHVQGSEALIVAVAHLHREPLYWRDRLR